MYEANARKNATGHELNRVRSAQYTEMMVNRVYSPNGTHDTELIPALYLLFTETLGNLGSGYHVLGWVSKLWM